MQSKVHPTYKAKYRVANWPAYNQALVRHGDVTVWLSSEAIAAWTPRRGGQRRYSDLAIETALTLRLLEILSKVVDGVSSGGLLSDAIDEGHAIDDLDDQLSPVQCSPLFLRGQRQLEDHR